MGLLDDAIREHLDLKRARGGDPAEIERMEREALGPVRREPTIGSPRFGSIEEPLPGEFHEPEFHEDHLADLEDLQELGYHDSTAPHPHPHHHEHPHEHHEHPHEHLEHPAPHHGFEDAQAEHLEHELEQLEMPKRRFLRRNRPASLSEPAAPPDPGFHEEPPGEHRDLRQRPETLARDERPAPPPPASPPPHLQFEHPPKRPRFMAEPPAAQPGLGAEPGGAEPGLGGEPEPPAEPLSAAPPTGVPAPAPHAASPSVPPPGPPTHPAPEYEHFDESPPESPEAQETTEFDVQKHLTETPGDQDQEQDEDMLEETPDFLQDTPEHDRLWFEQRPPKDFDFDG